MLLRRVDAALSLAADPSAGSVELAVRALSPSSELLSCPVAATSGSSLTPILDLLIAIIEALFLLLLLAPFLAAVVAVAPASWSSRAMDERRLVLPLREDDAVVVVVSPLRGDSPSRIS